MKQTHYLLLPFFLFISFYAKAQDLSGVWQGVLNVTSSTNYYSIVVSLEHKSDSVIGKSKTQAINAPYYAIHTLTGTFKNAIFNFRDEKILDSLIYDGFRWCMKKGDLHYSNDPESLKGIVETERCAHDEYDTIRIAMELYRLKVYADTILCQAQSIPIRASGQNIKWYQDSLKQKMLHSGTTAFLPFISQDTVFYVTQSIYDVESAPYPVRIRINKALYKQAFRLCDGERITVGDTIYQTSGKYLKLLKTQKGCDSFIETSLTIKPAPTIHQNLKICDNQTVTVGDTVYKTSGIYTRKLKTTEGCDSTVITDLTVNPIQQISQKRSICEGESLIVGDTIYRTTGTYTRRLKTLAGCDSLVSTQLSVFPVFKKTQTVSLCEGESLLVGDTVYRTTGIYTRKLRTSAGCDSLITTQLTLNTAKKTEQNIRLCAGKSISVGDTIYRTEGTYNRKLRSAAGCDSLVISYVSVVNEMRSNQKKTICEGSYMTVGDTTYRTTGIYEKRFRSSEGCDSIVTTDLKVMNLALQLSPDTLIHLGDSALLMAQINLPVSVSWKWTPSNALHCDTCPTTWAKPTTSTQYQIEVKDKETQCYKKGFVIIRTKTDCDLYIPNTFSPNGDNINDKWSIYPSPCIKNIKRVAVFNRWGNLIFEKQNLVTQNTASIDVWDGLIKGQLSAMETFIYILEAEYTNGRQVVLGGDVMVMH